MTEVKTMAAPATARISRALTNRSNAQHSTGPRTAAGKQRAKLNALRHGLTAQSPVLPTEDPAAYQRHLQQFLDEHRPATATETQLVHELASAAWRQNRIPLLEAELFDEPSTPQLRVQALATLGLHSQRLSRQFHKTLDQLRALQAERRERDLRDMKDAVALLDLHQHKGISWEPADGGFVFSKDEVERRGRSMKRLIEARQYACAAAFPRPSIHRAL